VTSYGIWNEPNNPTFLQIQGPKESGSAPADRYRQLYNAAWNTIKKSSSGAPAAYSGAKVMLGELAYFRRSGRLSSSTRCPSPKKRVRGSLVDRKRSGLNALDFLERVVRPTADAPQKLRTSAVAWHPYQHSDPPGDDGRRDGIGIGRVGDIRRRLECLRGPSSQAAQDRLLSTHSSGVPRLAFTEFGYFNTPRNTFPRTDQYRPIENNDTTRDGNRYWQTDGARATFFRGALGRAAKANRIPVGLFVFYTATEIEPEVRDTFPEGESRDLNSRTHIQEYGLFSRRGEVAGTRSYGKDQSGRNFRSLRFPQQRRAYCEIYRWAKGRDYGNPASPCQ